MVKIYRHNIISKLFLFLAVLLLSNIGISQKEVSLETKISNKLLNYRTTQRPEKIYVDTDKEFYVNGETIWFKTYLVDGISHTKSPKSRVIYVELLDDRDTPIVQKCLYVSDIGASGDFELSEKTPPGNYTLRAYTRYMFNEEQPLIFQKTIPIYTTGLNKEYSNSATTLKLESKTEEVLKSGLQVRFFPEGGELVNDLPNTMGIEILDENGRPVSKKGKLINQEGIEVMPFKTYEFGLGAIPFTPKVGDSYVIEIEHNGKRETYHIPEPKKQGYQLNVYNKGEEVLIHISASSKLDLKNMVVIGHVRGEAVLRQRITKPSPNGRSFTVKLLTKNIPDGVAHFTVFTPMGEPVCERLAFIDNPKNDVTLNIDSDKKNYNLRDVVSIDLQMTDFTGQGLSGELSISVVPVNNPLKRKINPSPSIKAWLLLQSDLGRSISNLDYFFVNNDNRRKYLLDLLMLTHGWRRFVWKDMLNRPVSKNIKFLPEQGITVYGSITDFENTYKSMQSTVKMTLFNGSDIYQQPKATNKDGSFDFGPFALLDSVPAVIEAISANGKKREDAAVKISPVFLKFPSDKIQILKQTEELEPNIQKYIRQAEQKKLADFNYGNVTQLEEVTVVAKKKKNADILDEEIRDIALYGEPGERTYVDSIPGQEIASAIDILRFASGVQVFGEYPNQKALIRGVSSISSSNDPLYLLDGFPIPEVIIQGMQASEIGVIDVLKGSEASMYGVEGANGVIAFYTKGRVGTRIGYQQDSSAGATNFIIPGFSKSREFYTPNYAKDGPESHRPDYRTTLHWEPSFKLNKDNHKIEFFLGDVPGNYQVKVQGITDDGRPVGATHAFIIGDNQ